ncbi:hypothetical protein TNIN_357131 [Trichonephila inaurata madagascariensis]|uniref:Uncharacterized protein n=1 Tax=Trichonephila inaurata madagascariensis TaxID=2747483 RepID=A0A8X6XDD0_9ARAC|nr:hypothetical protein TNIN_357131 [Trichonephila inaurata madagascariensis]
MRRISKKRLFPTPRSLNASSVFNDFRLLLYCIVIKLLRISGRFLCLWFLSPTCRRWKDVNINSYFEHECKTHFLLYRL